MNTPAMLWIGRILTGLFALFMLGASAAPKLLGLAVAEETMSGLGWPSGYTFMIGLIELTSVLLYLIPRTSVLGAVLMMGVLGGAMATHIRAGSPLFTHILFPIYVGLFMWGGLWLRDPRLRALFHWRGTAPVLSMRRDRRARRPCPDATARNIKPCAARAIILLSCRTAATSCNCCVR